jgi:hypothetical protein
MMTFLTEVMHAFVDLPHRVFNHRFFRHFSSLDVTLSHLHDKKLRRKQCLNTLFQISFKTMHNFSYLILTLLFACQEAEVEEVSTETQTIEATEQILEKGGVQSTLRLWPKEPALGDVLHLELRVTAKEGWSVEMPPFGEALGRFQIIDFEPSETEGPDKGRVYLQTYRLQAHHSGLQQIPSLRIQLTGTEGKTQELLTDEMSCAIQGILPKDAPLSLQPPRDKLTYFQTVPTEAIIGAGTLVLLAIGGVFWLRSRRTEEEILSAEQKAMQQLRLLEKSKSSEDKLDIFYQELSMILRRYIEGRFGLSAPEQTTEEFLVTLNNVRFFNPKQASFLLLFLRECDAIKFAGALASIKKAQEDLTLVRLFIQETKLTEEEGDDND